VQWREVDPQDINVTTTSSGIGRTESNMRVVLRGTGVTVVVIGMADVATDVIRYVAAYQTPQASKSKPLKRRLCGGHRSRLAAARLDRELGQRAAAR
jgi:hypothetical protein